MLYYYLRFSLNKINADGDEIAVQHSDEDMTREASCQNNLLDSYSSFERRAICDRPFG